MASEDDWVHPMLGVRCWSHDVDEPRDANTYRVCFECNHVYQTPEALVEGWVAAGGPVRNAKAIYCCPECAHDF